MNRAFTSREKVLFTILAVLLLGCFYYLMVLKPTFDTVAHAQTELASTQDEIMIQQAVAARKAQLEAEISKAEASGATKKTLPAYDNTKNIIRALNDILAGTSSCSITFADVDMEGALIRRNVSISFTSDSYVTAQSVLRKLIDCEYSCLITDVTLAGDGLGQTASEGKVTANVTVTFFESNQ